VGGARAVSTKWEDGRLPLSNVVRSNNVDRHLPADHDLIRSGRNNADHMVRRCTGNPLVYDDTILRYKTLRPYIHILALRDGVHVYCSLRPLLVNVRGLRTKLGSVLLLLFLMNQSRREAMLLKYITLCIDLLKSHYVVPSLLTIPPHISYIRSLSRNFHLGLPIFEYPGRCHFVVVKFCNLQGFLEQPLSIL
jgi:hypothetical protein